MSSSLPVRPAANNAQPFPLKLVPSAQVPPRSETPDVFERVRQAIAVLERRFCSRRDRRRHCTQKQARAALWEIGDLVALVGLHMPARTQRQRAAEQAIVGLVLDAINAACRRKVVV